MNICERNDEHIHTDQLTACKRRQTDMQTSKTSTAPSGSSPLPEAPPLSVPAPVPVPPPAPACIAFKASVTLEISVDTLPLPLPLLLPSPALHTEWKAFVSSSVRVSLCVCASLTGEEFYTVIRFVRRLGQTARW
jgi:hypothetical protein